MHRDLTSGQQLLAGLLLLGALAGNHVQAAPISEAAAARAGSSAQKIRKELDRTISIDIDHQPLPLAVKQLQEQTGVCFVLDIFTLKSGNVDPDEVVVGLKLKDMKVRSVLRALLTPHSLSYAILDDKVFISTEEAVVLRQMRQHVNVSFDKAPFAQALRQLARETVTNLVLDPRLVKNGSLPVTLELEDVQLEAAVRLMAEIVDLRPVRVGNTLFVTSKASAAELRQEAELAQQEDADGEVIATRSIRVRERVVPVKVAVPALPAPPGKDEEKKQEKSEEKPSPPDKP